MESLSSSERRRLMQQHLAQHQELDLAEACKLWGISPATARRDFVELEQTGTVARTWGRLRWVGANDAAKRRGAMVPFGEREVLELEAKKRIAREAASLLRPDDVVIIDGGTTTFQLVPYLATQRIKIVTNSIAIAHAIDHERAGRSGAEVFLTGGQLYPDSFLLVGPLAKASLRVYRANWVFLSAAGLDTEGVTNTNELVVETEQVMLERAERAALLLDSTKFNRPAMVPLCGLEKLTAIVTNDSPAPELADNIRAAGVELRVG